MKTLVKNKKGWIAAFYLAATIVLYILPYTKFTLPYIFMALAMLVSVPLLMLENTKKLNYMLLLLVVSLLFAIRCGFFPDYRIADAINEGIRNIRFFLPAFWGVYALQKMDKKQSAVVLIVFSLLVVYIFINTLVALEKDPEIARLLARSVENSSEELNAYRLANVGGFGFSYMMGMVALCLLWLFFIKKNWWIKIGSLILYLAIVYYAFQSQYTTLILLTLIGSIVLLFVCNKNFAFRVILIVVGIIVLLNIVNIFRGLSNAFGDSIIGVKFQRIVNSFGTGDIDNLGSRPRLIRENFEVWLRNPVFGAYSKEANAHSLIMNILSQMGFVGIGLFGFLFYKVYRFVLNEAKKYQYGRSLFNCATAYLLALSILNPIGYVFEVTIATYLVVCLFIKVFLKKTVE
ncbi:MAG: hypothetical protein E7680_02625 [Ruminococcaceae bacterium]|nr:hypothetical protein [Oscillospiraceae bacterium]